MALVILGGVVGQASGRLGSTVFSKNRGGVYVRTGTKPVNTITGYRSTIRANLSAASKAWTALTVAQQTAWNTWAQSISWKNRLGQTIALSGQQAFIQLMARVLLVGGVLYDDPPTAAVPEGISGVTLSADIGAGDFEIAWTSGALGASEVLVCRGCVKAHASQTFITNSLVGFYMSAAAATTPEDLQAAAVARFGTLQAGQIFHVEYSVVDNLTGLQSAVFRASATITDTP